MTDHQADADPTQDDLEAAEKIEAANIADEGAAYTIAIDKSADESKGAAEANDQADT